MKRSKKYYPYKDLLKLDNELIEIKPTEINQCLMDMVSKVKEKTWIKRENFSCVLNCKGNKPSLYIGYYIERMEYQANWLIEFDGTWEDYIWRSDNFWKMFDIVIRSFEYGKIQ